MQYKLSYTLFIKHFLEKKLEHEFSLYIDEKTQNILHFTNTTDELYYEKIYNKVIAIERTAAADSKYAMEIWDKITRKPIIKTMINYYGDLVAYHFHEDINYEEVEDQQHLIYKLFPKTALSYLGHDHHHRLHKPPITSITSITEEFIQTIIYEKKVSSPKNSHNQKAYSCISKYYPSFFEYTHRRKNSPPSSTRATRKTPEEETISYIHSWMQ